MREENITLLTFGRELILLRKITLHTYKLPLEPMNYTSPPLASNTKKKIGRKSRLLMGRGLAHKRYGNSLPMIHKMYLKDRLDGIPRTLLLIKRRALSGRKTYKKEDSH